MSKAIGIDLGTFNSAAAVAFGRDNVQMIASADGETDYGKDFPSFVLFDHSGRKQKVGKYAKAELSFNHEVVIWGVKRLVGLSYETAKKSGEIDRFQYNIEEGPRGSILIRVGEERFSPSHILEFILREIKESAENSNVNPIVGETVDHAVISVPAYFDGTRVSYIKEAAYNAGFKEVQTIPEPTAAAMVYGLDLKKECKILTFDIGAGTLDVTIMQFLEEGGELICSESATSGDPALGGVDMDKALMDYIIKRHNLDHVREDRRSMSKLNKEVETAKVKLSTRMSFPIDIPNLLSVDLTRKELEDVMTPILDKCRGPIRVALREAELEAKNLDHILFVGGPTYMPCVRAMVMDELKKLGARKDLLQELASFEEKGLPVNPMEAVARGASLKAGNVAKPNIQSDPGAYGTRLNPVPNLPDYFYAIIPSNSSYPITRCMGIIHYNPQAQRVSIPLFKKLPFDERGKTVYRYYYLGDYDCFIRSTGDDPSIDITMELDSDKVLITTFTHKQTGESMTLERLNELMGKDVILQDHTPPPPENNSHVDSVSQGGGQRRILGREYTQQQFEQAIHAAQAVLDQFAEHSQDAKVMRKKEELCALIQSSHVPSKHTHLILGRIQELLNALKNSKGISEDDFHNYREQLKNIARND